MFTRFRNFVVSKNGPSFYISYDFKTAETQGPLPNTIEDFWKMVIESESQLIIMVTQLVQNGRKKSEKYWPELHAEFIFGEATIKTISEEPAKNGVIERLFSVHTTTSCGDTSQYLKLFLIFHKNLHFDHM